MRSGSPPVLSISLVVVATLLVPSLWAPIPVAAAGRSEPPPTTLKLGYDGPAVAGRNPSHHFVEALQAEVEERSEGRLSVAPFPENQLGTPEEILELETEEPVLVVASAATLGRRVPALDAAAIPFLFADAPAARAFFDESEFFRRARAALLERAEVVLLAEVEAWTPVGFSSAAAPVRTPADFDGMQVAVSDERYRAMIETFGARVIPAGDPDGWLGSAAELLARGLQERFPYRTETAVTYPRSYLLAAPALLESLSGEERRILTEAAAAATETHRRRVDGRAETIRDALVAGGVSVYRPTATEEREFQRIAQPAYIDGLEERISLEWITLALDGAAEYSR